MGPKLVTLYLGIDGISEKWSKPVRVCTAFDLLNSFQYRPSENGAIFSRVFPETNNVCCENKPKMFVQKTSIEF